jgi:glycosyltransferase involved in cell wall biosynthesis
MVIAVNTRFLLKDYLEGYGNFIFETFSRLAASHPADQFIYIFDREYDPAFVTSNNITAVVIGPPARHPMLWKWWYDIRIPTVLKKHKADVFVSPDGFCSLATKIPQCLVMHDLAFRHYPSFLKASHLGYYRRNTPKFLKKANTVATVSNFSKKDILSTYHVDPSKIQVVFSGTKEIFKPLDSAEKEAVKEKYTAGKEYFVYTGAIHPRKNLMNLLKAFSIFKKRQQTATRLLLTGRLAWKYGSFAKSLQTYKYRDDVLLTGYVDEAELAKITGAAYALVYPSLFEGFGVPVLEAMRCDVPVITSPASSMEEIAGDAALYADPADPASIAAQMMRLYKDEQLRRQLIEKGRTISKNYSWDNTAALLWESILKAVG